MNPSRSLRIPAAAAALALAALAAAPTAEASRRGDSPNYYVSMDPPIVYPGAVMRLQVRPPADAEGGTVLIAGRRYPGHVEDGMFTVYFAVDIDTLPGPYDLVWDVGSRHGSRTVTVRARRMDEEGRGAWSLSRDDRRMEELARAHPRLLGLWNRLTLQRYWSGAFQSPVEAPMVATFAMRSSTATRLGPPHTGVDFAPKSRATVRAAALGVVSLVADGPGGRQIVILDHGFGLYTYYFGMGEAEVEEGKLVRRGASLGNMPSRKNSVLHFGARLAGAEVDPVSLPGIALRVPTIRRDARRAPKEEKDRVSDYDF